MHKWALSSVEIFVQNISEFREQRNTNGILKVYAIYCVLRKYMIKNYAIISSPNSMNNVTVKVQESLSIMRFSPIKMPERWIFNIRKN
jgi:hypothetical protein